MSEKDAQSVPSQGGNWVFDLGALRVHNAHIQSGQFTSRSCGTCEEGLEGIMAPIAVVPKPDEVAEGDGSDAEDGAALPRSYRADY